jgi:hypothetical protein
LLVVPALAADPAVDPDLTQFRAAYILGDGLAYVVINDDKGEQIYRYGDVSWLIAKKDAYGYMLFTCNSPHLFIVQKAENKAALTKATMVKPEDPRFEKLMRSICLDATTLVKSAIPKGNWDRLTRRHEFGGEQVPGPQTALRCTGGHALSIMEPCSFIVG